MKALIVFAHGSPVESANEAIRVVARQLQSQTGEHVQPAFLDGGQPGLRGAVEACVESGATEIAVLPYFLTLGLHLQRDLPVLVAEVRAAYPAIDIRVAQPLDGHPALINVLQDRSAEVL